MNGNSNFKNKQNKIQKVEVVENFYKTNGEYFQKLFLSLNLQFGDYIEVINSEIPINDSKINNFIGEKGIITGFRNIFGTRHRYSIWFENESARKIYEKGSMHFCPSYIKKLDRNENIFLQYVLFKEVKKETEEYKWGTCEECAKPLDMYYNTWCPNCQKPSFEITRNGESFLNIIKILIYAQSQLEIEDIYSDFWHYINDDFDNNSYSKLSLLEGDYPEDLHITVKFIKKEWDLTGDDVLIFSSW
jgi:hypothetical protein